MASGFRGSLLHPLPPYLGSLTPEARTLKILKWGFPKIRVPFWNDNNKDYTILGSFWETTKYCKLSYRLQVLIQKSAQGLHGFLLLAHEDRGSVTFCMLAPVSSCSGGFYVSSFQHGSLVSGFCDHKGPSTQ